MLNQASRLLLSSQLSERNNNNNLLSTDRLSSVHTLAASHVSQSGTQTGSVATAESERKTAKYSKLSSSHVFYPVALKTFGSLADEAFVFLAEIIGRRATLCTADPRETTFLYQCIPVTIKRFNAVCLANSLTVPVVTIPDITLHFDSF